MLPILPTLAEQRRDTNIGALQANQPASCRGLSFSTRDRVVRRAGALRADITGDGRPDRVFVAERPHARSCQFLLVVRTLDHTYAASLRQRGSDISWPNRDAPKLVLAAPIDYAPGRDIVVAVDAGASSTSLAVFALHRDLFARLRIPKAANNPDAFVYGGSLAGSYTVNCIGPRKHGLVLESALANGANGRSFDVTRTIYKSQNFTFRFVSYRAYHALLYAEVRARFPELRRDENIFSSCR